MMTMGSDIGCVEVVCYLDDAATLRQSGTTFVRWTEWAVSGKANCEAVAMTPRKPYTQLIDCVPRDPNYDAELFRSSINFRAESGDLVLHTYPKSGTHLLLYITQCILNKGEGARTYEEFAESTRLLGGMNFADWRPPLPLRLFSTHLPPQRSAINEQAKYVDFARNPWDACVSLFHMVTDFSTYRFQDGTFD
ncbi:hypothetical protein HPB51_002731 [Rhipicephalus microplus]|uniref:Sulfotransferase domain-containing protein n=1 Tax=Rhipicephalus microplus TaxID=6941 RepID=A0A9J6EWL5_RHIMP|nr:hypothetical protein HPB51_002731 [Rhipicephalus microplus]